MAVTPPKDKQAQPTQRTNAPTVEAPRKREFDAPRAVMEQLEKQKQGGSKILDERITGATYDNFRGARLTVRTEKTPTAALRQTIEKNVRSFLESEGISGMNVEVHGQNDPIGG